MKQDRFGLVQKFVKQISELIVGSWEQTIAYFDTLELHRTLHNIFCHLNQYRIVFERFDNRKI